MEKRLDEANKNPKVKGITDSDEANMEPPGSTRPATSSMFPYCAMSFTYIIFNTPKDKSIFSFLQSHLMGSGGRVLF